MPTTPSPQPPQPPRDPQDSQDSPRPRADSPAPSRARLLADVPEHDRPRERLLRNGAASLNDAELVAILLRSGTRDLSVLDMAEEILAENAGLAGLVGLVPKQLHRPGLGDAKAATLMAAVELGCRLAWRDVPERDPLGRPREVAAYLHQRYRLRDQEVLGALFLDSRHRLLGEREIYRGTLFRAAVEPREVLKQGLLAGAAGIVLFHTHPSGDPSPSLEDWTFTRRLAAAGQVVGLDLVDHMILGTTGRWVSMAALGPLLPSRTRSDVGAIGRRRG